MKNKKKAKKTCEGCARSWTLHGKPIPGDSLKCMSCVRNPNRERLRDNYE